MKSKLSHVILSLALFIGLQPHAASAQIVSIPGLGTQTLTGTDGDYQLNPNGPAHVDQLDGNNGALPSLTVNLNNGLGQNMQNSAGWAFSGAQGNTWIADLDLGDPKVSYSIAFQNTTSTTQTYNVSFSVPISPAETFNPANVRSTISGSLLNGGDNASIEAIMAPVLASTTGAAGSFLQTSTLTLAGGSTVDSTNVDLSTGTITAPGDGGNTTFMAQTLNFSLFNPNGPSGTYSALNVNLSFTLTPGDYASFTGRVDVEDVPEPSSVALSFLGLGFLALVIYIRRTRTA